MLTAFQFAAVSGSWLSDAIKGDVGVSRSAVWGFRSVPVHVNTLNLGHFQVGSCRYRSLIEGLYTL